MTTLPGLAPQASSFAPMKTPELLDRLQRHYIKPGDALPGGIFVPEVTHGSYGGRRVDALYVGFTSSRGHHLVGHEIKVSRSDWLHELKSIDKAETWASQCHAWYLVTANPTIARVEELPHGWGLMTVDPKTKTRLHIVERALVHPDRQPDWLTMHSVLKRLDTLRDVNLRAARNKAEADVQAEMMELRVALAKQRLTGADDATAKTDALLADICEILGVKSFDRGGWGSGTLTLEELRTGFARFLLAGRDADRALRGRDTQLQNAAYALESLASALAAAQAHIKKA